MKLFRNTFMGVFILLLASGCSFDGIFGKADSGDPAAFMSNDLSMIAGFDHRDEQVQIDFAGFLEKMPELKEVLPNEDMFAILEGEWEVIFGMSDGGSEDSELSRDFYFVGKFEDISAVAELIFVLTEQYFYEYKELEDGNYWANKEERIPYIAIYEDFLLMSSDKGFREEGIARYGAGNGLSDDQTFWSIIGLLDGAPGYFYSDLDFRYNDVYATFAPSATGMKISTKAYFNELTEVSEGENELVLMDDVLAENLVFYFEEKDLKKVLQEYFGRMTLGEDEKKISRKVEEKSEEVSVDNYYEKIMWQLAAFSELDRFEIEDLLANPYGVGIYDFGKGLPGVVLSLALEEDDLVRAKKFASGLSTYFDSVIDILDETLEFFDDVSGVLEKEVLIVKGQPLSKIRLNWDNLPAEIRDQYGVMFGEVEVYYGVLDGNFVIAIYPGFLEALDGERLRSTEKAEGYDFVLLKGLAMKEVLGRFEGLVGEKWGDFVGKIEEGRMSSVKEEAGVKGVMELKF
jgi:hypothetical protein